MKDIKPDKPLRFEGKKPLKRATAKKGEENMRNAVDVLKEIGH